MPGTKEIRVKIKSVQNTRKITKAMEMVAASKMRKAQERMRAARPYGEKIRNVAAHISHANPEYRHPFLVSRDTVKRVGLIVITTDKGLCGALNTNLLRMALNQYKAWQAEGEEIDVCCIGNKGFGFMQRLGANIVSHAIQIGDRPQMDKLIGTIKVMLDGYTKDRFDRLVIGYTRFLNTMKQEPVLEQLLPLSGERLGAPETVWDYLYEPEAKAVLDQVMTRYIEAIIFQAVAENMASEQSARMVAMKAASDNARDLIDELTLIYNKNRQAGITKELSEIVGGRRGRIENSNLGNHHGTSSRNHRPVRRRSDRHRIPPRIDAEGLRRSEARRHGRRRTRRKRPDLRSRAATRRRRGALHRAGILRRPAPRHESEQHRRPDLGPGWAGYARPHHGRARPPDRRSRPDQIATSCARSTRPRPSSTSCPPRWTCSKPASR